MKLSELILKNAPTRIEIIESKDIDWNIPTINLPEKTIKQDLAEIKQKLAEVESRINIDLTDDEQIS